MKGLRIGLCAVFAFTVFAHGAVEVWSQSILEIGAVILLVAWAWLACRQGGVTIHWSPLIWPILGLMAIGLVQLALGWTAYAYLTQVELLKLFAYVIIFFLSAQAFRARADLMRLAWFLVFLGFAVSLLGIIQHFTSGGKIYWVRELPFGGDFFGPYVNRNHFAGFVELVVPVGLALMVFRGLRRDLFPMAGLLTIVPVGALILSGSRGGIVSFAFEVCVLALLARSRRAIEGPRLVAIGVVGLAALALIAWIGADKAIERFSTVKPGEVTLSRRFSMARGALRVFLAHPVKGTGLGTLIDVYPQFETAYDGKVVDHAHDDYVEGLADMGLLGGICGLAFLWILFREAKKNFWAEQGHFSRALHAGAITALSGLLLHSFVDFNLHIPSNALLFLLQAYLATSPPLPTEAPPSRRRETVSSDVPSEVAG